MVHTGLEFLATHLLNAGNINMSHHTQLCNLFLLHVHADVHATLMCGHIHVYALYVTLHFQSGSLKETCAHQLAKLAGHRAPSSTRVAQTCASRLGFYLAPAGKLKQEQLKFDTSLTI